MKRVAVISDIADVIEDRKGASPEVSYVAKLFSKAPDAALKKVGEERIFGFTRWLFLPRQELDLKRFYLSCREEREPQG